MSKIEWTNETWNPITGCTKISPGCQNCYAEKMAKRLKGRFGYPETDPFSVTYHYDVLKKPFAWKKPRMVFVCSMGDLFHEEVSYDMAHAVFSAMEALPQHTFQILTKRPERMKKFWDIKSTQWGEQWKPTDNIWIGVSAENQEQANKRIPILLQIPAAIRFVSCEPLLSKVDLKHAFSPLPGEMSEGQRGLDWVIAGGESGHNARPMHPDWVRSLRDQCQDACVPFFFKQWGEWQEGSNFSDHKYQSRHITMLSNGDYADDFSPEVGDMINKYSTNEWNKLNAYTMAKVGKKRSGRLLDEKEWNEMPIIKS